MADILFYCHLCGASLQVDAKGAGLKGPCPECGKEITIPNSTLNTRKPTISDMGSPRANNTMENEIYLDKNVRVTTARIIIGNTTYALRNITSIKTTKTPPSTGRAVMLLFLSIIGLLAGLVIPFQSDVSIKWTVLVLVFAAIALALSILWLRNLKTSYHLMITSTASETNALTSFDKDYILTVVAKINEAIVKCS